MTCNDIAAIIDEHRAARLAAAERSAIDAHLLACADCAAAWHAQTELLAVPVPAAAPLLLDRVLAAVAARARPRRASRRVAVAGAVLVAGAALAAVTVTQWPDPPAPRGTTTSVAPRPTPADSTRPGAPADTAPSTARRAADRPIDMTAIAQSIVPIVREPPVYPADALKRGLEGSVTLRFDVTARGRVENAAVTHSTDAVFDAAALAAITQWRYLPRLADGKRVASENVQTVIRFQLDQPGSPPPLIPRPTSTGDPYLKADSQTFTAALKVALDRTGADDFRGAELELDELRARYRLEDFQEANAWDFYAYLYLVEGNYDRAIEACETAVAAYARAGVPSQSSSLALANLYFARHQYAEALQTLLRHKQAVANTPLLAGRSNPIVDGFIDKLRALGVTEETLPPGR